MAFAVAGLFAEGETVITDAGCAAISYPGFSAHLKELTQPTKKKNEKPTPVITSMREGGLPKKKSSPKGEASS